MKKYFFSIFLLVLLPTFSFAGDWTASGFGNTDYNGCYTDQATSFNTNPTYKNSNNKYLFVANARYQLDTSATNASTFHYYSDTVIDPTGTWTEYNGETAPGGTFVSSSCSGGGDGGGGGSASSTASTATSTVDQIQNNIFYSVLLFFTSMFGMIYLLK